MNQTDTVRAYVLSHYVTPARKTGKNSVTIRAGDVAKVLKLQHRMPLVCGALGAAKFQKESNLRLVYRTGPQSGSTATFTFSI